MSGLRLPVSLLVEYRGLDSLAGEFTDETGTKIVYGDAHRFDVEQPDGTTTSFGVRVGKLDLAADFDVATLKKGDYVRLDGIAASGDRGMYLIPVTVVKAKASELSAVA